MQSQKHTKYGHKRIKGKTVKHITETRMAFTIFEMREKGLLSFQVIADILNEMKTPIKMKGKSGVKECLETFILKNKEIF